MVMGPGSLVADPGSSGGVDSAGFLRRDTRVDPGRGVLLRMVLIG